MGVECTEFIDSGAGVTVYHLYNVTGCNYISKSSLVVDIRYKGTTEWESWATYTMGGYEGFTYYWIEIGGGAGFEFRATYKGITKYYSINEPCIPNWKCSQPLDGYETDINNCGESDRYNEDCVDPCVGVTCPDYCDLDAHVKYVNGICVDGSCVYDTEENSVECGYDPCVGVTCPDYCDLDAHVKYVNGICVDGSCVYDTEEKSVECGYDPYEGVVEDNTKYLLILGGVGAVALGIFLAVAKSK